MGDPYKGVRIADNRGGVLPNHQGARFNSGGNACDCCGSICSNQCSFESIDLQVLPVAAGYYAWDIGGFNPIEKGFFYKESVELSTNSVLDGESFTATFRTKLIAKYLPANTPSRTETLIYRNSANLKVVSGTAGDHTGIVFSAIGDEYTNIISYRYDKASATGRTDEQVCDAYSLITSAADADSGSQFFGFCDEQHFLCDSRQVRLTAGSETYDLTMNIPRTPGRFIWLPYPISKMGPNYPAKAVIRVSWSMPPCESPGDNSVGVTFYFERDWTEFGLSELESAQLHRTGQGSLYEPAELKLDGVPVILSDPDYPDISVKVECL